MNLSFLSLLNMDTDLSLISLMDTEMLGSYLGFNGKDSTVPASCEDWYKNGLVSFLSPTPRSNVTPAKAVDPCSVFDVVIDVCPFDAHDIFIRTEGEYLYIEAKHEEIPEDIGFVKREFTRRYKIPNDTKTENMKAARFPSGMLWVNAPRTTQKSETPSLRTMLIRLQFPGFEGVIEDLLAKAVEIPITRGVQDKAKEA